MTKTTAKIITVAAIISLLAGCSGFGKQVETEAEYQGSGEVVEFHANGKVKRNALYLDGQLVTVVSYYASGAEQSNEQYELGEIHSATYYFRNGRVKTKIIGE